MQKITCRNNFDEIVDIPKEKFVFRPSAYGIVCDGDNVLFLRNKGNGKLWLPGGGIEIGERIEDGLRREMKEETGLDIITSQFLFARENFFYYQPLDEAYHAFLFFYLCTPKNTAIAKDHLVDDLESEKPRWINISDLTAEKIADFGNDIIEALKNI